MIQKILYVGIGGFAGASLRWLVGGWMQQLFSKSVLPIGTFTVNMLGCLLIGLLMGLAESRNMFTPEIRLLVFTGLLGSFTTFSTFALESFNFMQDGQFWPAFLNIGLQVVLGVLLVFIGIAIAKTL